jgi:hypothetical protein
MRLQYTTNNNLESLGFNTTDTNKSDTIKTTSIRLQNYAKKKTIKKPQFKILLLDIFYLGNPPF